MIAEFQGPYRFLSNFWPVVVEFDAVYYPSVEHAYVAAKTLDLGARAAVLAVSNPGAVKRIGRTLTLRPDWEEVRIPAMTGLIRQKFEHADLRAMLLSTSGEELVEGNAWGDVFWGVCRGVGENNLGKILMAERERINGLG